MSAHLKALVGVIAVGLVILGISFYWYSGDSQKADTSTLSLLENMKADRVPPVEQVDLDGKSFRLDDVKNQILVVNFWASWCEPCIEEVPSLLNLVEKMNGKVALVAISGDSDRVEIDSFLKSFPGLKREHVFLLWDEDKQAMKSFGVERLPETFIVGPDMKLIRKVVGSVRWDHDESIKYFTDIVQKYEL